MGDQSQPMNGEGLRDPNVEVYASGQYIRMSAHKARRVLDQIRGLYYEQTLMMLELMPYRACYSILKLVYSAAANASHNMAFNKEDLIISQAAVNGGTLLKRLKPRARGRKIAREVRLRISMDLPISARDLRRIPVCLDGEKALRKSLAMQRGLGEWPTGREGFDADEDELAETTLMTLATKAARKSVDDGA
ncbi:hypothetical protein Syun_011851 [Stephania yunnanensis]|uniref:Large ribosomal subunit protein uL22c n=1 Tax=Stephania yunnanensis TaxID=152371 RepID=A0AAP0PIW3_9MAGN